jgi:hypothetical protein
VLAWHGYAWNLERPQRVDDPIRRVASVAFGRHDDPFRAPAGGSVRNIRFAVGRRAAEVRLAPVADLDEANRAATTTPSLTIATSSAVTIPKVSTHSGR